MFDRWISIDDIKAIALHGEPGLLKVLSRDGGFVMVQIGRNMFERVDIRANRLYQIKKLQQLYAEHDITVSESAATGFGWVLATPMIRRTFVRLSVAETVIVGVTVAVMVFRLAT